jgi:glucokinase
MILVGDIGGTKVRLGLASKSGKVLIKDEAFFLSCQFSSFEDILQEYLKKKRGKISRVCLGIAGPVIKGRLVKTTNLPWIIDRKNIQKILQVEKVDLLNDLQATAFGLSVLESKDFFVLQRGFVHPEANVALVEAGTGLGEAGLIWSGNQLLPLSSEGGHVDFSPQDAREWELFCELKQTFGHVSCERILSRSGLVLLFSFLQKKEKKKSSLLLNECKERDASFLIIEKAVKEKEPLCQAALDWFCSLYGREAGNLALKFLALRGIYIGGGIAPLIASFLKKSHFLSSFTDKGRFSSLMSRIPVKVILNERAPLLGAAEFSRKH